MKNKDLDLLLNQGLFSELDIHFARLMTRLSGQDLPELFLASALVSRATSEGHVCLDLSSVAGSPLITDDPAAETFICPQLRQWCKKLNSSGVVGRPGKYKPLILDDRSRIYLYRYWQYEQTLADDIRARAAKETKGIDTRLLKDGLSRLFLRAHEGETDWQGVAAFTAVMKGLSVISGGPGTGKSFLIAKILALILEQGTEDQMRIALAAPTGKAAARLQEAIKNCKAALPVKEDIKAAIPAEASTIHRLLGTIPGSSTFRHNAENELPVHMVVIDEASMVDLALMSKLVQAVPSGARLVLLGDKDQLASVEAGAVLGDICDTGRVHGFSQKFSDRFLQVTGDRLDIGPESSNGREIQDCVVRLQKSYRFGGHSGIAKVSRAVNKGHGDLALELLKKGGFHDIRWKALPAPNALPRELRESVIQGYRPYLEAADPLKIFQLFDGFRLLCALRKGPYGVFALNLLIEQVLQEERLIDTGKQWYRGRPILITKNDYNLGLFNGDIGIILPDPASNNELRARFLSPDGTVRRFPPVRLHEHETVYAMTVHKCQGSEFDRALLVLPEKPSPVLTRELIYTGITRARESAEVWAREGVFLEAVRKRTQRGSGLRDALWGEECL